jgi:DUF917 family protein
MDRFDRIKERMKYAIDIGELSREDTNDIEFLISEVERLRKANTLTNEKIAEIRRTAYNYGKEDMLKICQESIRGFKEERHDRIP